MNREQVFASRIQADRSTHQGRLRYLVVVPRIALLNEVWQSIVAALRTTGDSQMLPLSIVGAEARLGRNAIIQLHPWKTNVNQLGDRQFTGIWFTARPSPELRDRCIARLAPDGWIFQ